MKNAKKLEITAVLHNIRSLHNVGSIFRTADAVGISRIYLTGFTPPPLDRFGKPREQFTKVSLGAEKYVAWDGSSRSPQATLKLLEKLKKEKYKIFAVEQAENSVPYYKAGSFAATPAKNKRKFALVLGNERRGLPPAILKLADKILEIPMRGAMVRQARHPKNAIRKTLRQAQGKESLNVAVAAGIIFFRLRYPE